MIWKKLSHIFMQRAKSLFKDLNIHGVRNKFYSLWMFKIMGCREECYIFYTWLYNFVSNTPMMSKITEKEEWKSSKYWKRVTCIMMIRACMPNPQSRQLLSTLKHHKNDTKYEMQKRPQNGNNKKCNGVLMCLLWGWCPDPNIYPPNSPDFSPMSCYVWRILISNKTHCEYHKNQTDRQN